MRPAFSSMSGRPGIFLTAGLRGAESSGLTCRQAAAAARARVAAQANRERVMVASRRPGQGLTTKMEGRGEISQALLELFRGGGVGRPDRKEKLMLVAG